MEDELYKQLIKGLQKGGTEEEVPDAPVSDPPGIGDTNAEWSKRMHAYNDQQDNAKQMLHQTALENEAAVRALQPQQVQEQPTPSRAWDGEELDDKKFSGINKLIGR